MKEVKLDKYGNIIGKDGHSFLCPYQSSESETMHSIYCGKHCALFNIEKPVIGWASFDGLTYITCKGDSIAILSESH